MCCSSRAAPEAGAAQVARVGAEEPWGGSAINRTSPSWLDNSKHVGSSFDGVALEYGSERVLLRTCSQSPIA